MCVKLQYEWKICNKCVVFWGNLQSWQLFYRTAGYNKFQLWSSPKLSVHSTDKQATLLRTLHILLHSTKHPVRLLYQTHHLHLQCPQITSLSTHIKAQVLQLLCSTSPESVAIELDWGTLQNIPVPQKRLKILFFFKSSWISSKILKNLDYWLSKKGCIGRACKTCHRHW